MTTKEYLRRFKAFNGQASVREMRGITQEGKLQVNVASDAEGEYPEGDELEEIAGFIEDMLSQHHIEAEVRVVNEEEEQNI